MRKKNHLCCDKAKDITTDKAKDITALKPHNNIRW